MSLTQYDYVQDTHLILLQEEIGSSTITVALDHIDYELGTTSIWFKAPLTAGEKTTLDGILAVHDKDSYVSPTPVVETTFTRQPEDDSKIPYVYASPRPMNHYSYFTSTGDSVGVGDGNKLIFDLAAGDTSKYVDVTFIEDVYLKDGLIQSKNAPFGAMVDIDVWHPIAGYLLSFGKNIPIYGDFPIQLNTEDRASVPAGLIIRVTVRNATGAGGDDPAAAFKVLGRLELYRPKPAGT